MTKPKRKKRKDFSPYDIGISEKQLKQLRQDVYNHNVYMQLEKLKSRDNK